MTLPRWPFKPKEIITPAALDVYTTELDRLLGKQLEQAEKYDAWSRRRGQPPQPRTTPL